MPTASLFKEKQVRRACNTTEEKLVFSINDIHQALTGAINVNDCIKKLRKRDPDLDSYWGTNCPPVGMIVGDWKKRFSAEGNETVTNCNSLKMTAADGKQHMTDVTETAQLFRLIQSIPSHKAEPFKRWLAKAGYERLEEIENPALAAKRTRLLGSRWKPGARPPVSHSFRINILTHVSIRAHRVKGDIRCTFMRPKYDMPHLGNSSRYPGLGCRVLDPSTSRRPHKSRRKTSDYLSAPPEKSFLRPAPRRISPFPSLSAALPRPSLPSAFPPLRRFSEHCQTHIGRAAERPTMGIFASTQRLSPRMLSRPRTDPPTHYCPPGFEALSFFSF